jgi:hypothetical protein
MACPLLNLPRKTLEIGDVPPGFLPLRYHLRVHTEPGIRENVKCMR